MRRRFAIGSFSSNVDGGSALTSAPERWQARWQDTLTAGQIADRFGLDFLLPIARWRGYGGSTRAREWSLETFTWAAGLASVTRSIALFMTVHVPLVHPLYAAKALATVDHISNGRAGLNVVCGWDPDEFGMFGLAQEQNRYGQAREWLEIIERAYTASEPFDYPGRFYDLKGVVSRPPSIQKPRPFAMNAAFSDAGRRFAVTACDCLFTVFIDIADLGRHVAHIREIGDQAARQIPLFTVAHVVCRESQAAAEDYYERTTVTMVDEEALDNHVRKKRDFASGSEYAQYRRRFAGGAGSYPLVGTPEHVAEQLIAIAGTGCAGIALSFVNYTYELPFFCDRVLPLLERAGLRGFTNPI